MHARRRDVAEDTSEGKEEYVVDVGEVAAQPIVSYFWFYMSSKIDFISCPPAIISINGRQ